MLYPQYLSVKIGTIDFTTCRIIIAVIYLNIFLRTDLAAHFKFILLDKLVIAFFLAQILAGATTTPLAMLLENRAGAVFDFVLPYFAIRMLVTSKKEYLNLLRVILVIAAPLAIAGFYQCLTGNNPVGFLSRYKAWNYSGGRAPAIRGGLFRASITFPHSILFGLFFSMLGPVCAGLIPYAKNKNVVYFGLILICVGVFSSMSSGPLLTCVFAVMFIALWRWQKYWKVAVVVVIGACLFIEVASNRHFYEVVDRLVIAGSASWYRARLFEVSLFEGGMSGHWITGYGFSDPGWGINIDGRAYSDVVNHYLVLLCRYGLVGLLPFLTIIGVAFRQLVLSYRVCVTKPDKWCVWCLSAGLFGLLGGMYGVMLNGQPRTFFYIMLACCASMPAIIKAESINIRQARAATVESNSTMTAMFAEGT